MVRKEQTLEQQMDSLILEMCGTIGHRLSVYPKRGDPVYERIRRRVGRCHVRRVEPLVADTVIPDF